MAATTVPIMHSVYFMRKKFMVGMFETNRESGSPSDNGSVFDQLKIEMDYVDYFDIPVRFLTCLKSFHSPSSWRLFTVLLVAQ